MARRYRAAVGLPKKPDGRKMMNANSTMNVTASLHCGSSFQ